MTVDNMALAVKKGITNFLQEYEAGHREMLLNQCQGIGEKKLLWLKEIKDYIPYYVSRPVQKVLGKAKSLKIGDFIDQQIQLLGH